MPASIQTTFSDIYPKLGNCDEARINDILTHSGPQHVSEVKEAELQL